MILTFQPSPGSAAVPLHIIGKKYDLSDGSLSPFRDKYTGYFSAEAFLIDLETILTDPEHNTVIIKKIQD